MGQTANISAHVVQEIDELICNPDELGQHAAVFDLKIGEQHYGPIEAAQLKEFFLIHDDLAEEAQVKRTSEELYTSYFEHPHFQRRRPQLVRQQSLEDVEQEYLWVLKDGQKNGPYTKTQLNEQVESSQLLRTDLVSLDEGQTWQRLYEIEEFDRRKLESNQLPATPEGQVFVNSLRETRSQLARAGHQREEDEALTGLAYIGNLRNGKGVEGEKRVPRPIGAQVGKDQSASFELPKQVQEPQWIWYGLFAASLMGIVALLLTWQDSAPKRSTDGRSQNGPAQMAREIEPEPTQQDQNQAPIQPRRSGQDNRNTSRERNQPNEKEREPVDTFDSRPKTISRPRTRTRTRTQSFRESKAYRQAQSRSAQQERQMEDDPYQEDDYYYDEGDVPPEQDPVRSQLSRETTDPRNSWADDLESIEDDPEYYEPDYVEPGVYPEEELYEEY